MEDTGFHDQDPQKSSAAQFLTYIASNGVSNERYEIRYENESIWMSQKMLAAVYGVEIPNVSYHLKKIFEDAELDPKRSIKEFLIDIEDGRKFSVKHYNLQIVIALGFKINNERAVQFRKWANELVEKFTNRLFMSDYDRYLLALEEEAHKVEEKDENNSNPQG